MSNVEKIPFVILITYKTNILVYRFTFAKKPNSIPVNYTNVPISYST